MHLVSQVSNECTVIFSFIIIILLRSENVCTFVSQVSNGCIVIFLILIFNFTKPLQATVVLRLYFASLMSLHYVTMH